MPTQPSSLLDSSFFQAPTSTPASSATATSPPPSYTNCASGYLCIYHDQGGIGPMAYFSHGDNDLSLAPMGILNDHVYSAWNNSGNDFCIYYDAGYGGASTTIPPGSQGNLGSDFANNVSSLRIMPSNGC